MKMEINKMFHKLNLFFLDIKKKFDKTNIKEKKKVSEIRRYIFHI